jgi:hypothetical protein
MFVIYYGLRLREGGREGEKKVDRQEVSRKRKVKSLEEDLEGCISAQQTTCVAPKQ